MTKSQVRDFHSAMLRRGNYGLIITTDTFTTSPNEEAVRDRVSLIELVDGKQLVERLKQLELGVKTEKVEQVTVSNEGFQGLRLNLRLLCQGASLKEIQGVQRTFRVLAEYLERGSPRLVWCC